MGAGSNKCGRLGTGRTDASSCGWGLGAASTDEKVPAQVSTALVVNWEQVTTGFFHTCGLSSRRYAYCWGQNIHGQLGSSDAIQKNTPNRVASQLQWTMLAAGDKSTCGLASGKLYCWGTSCGRTPGQTSPEVDPSPNFFSQISMGVQGYYNFPVNAIGIALPAPPSPPVTV